MRYHYAEAVDFGSTLPPMRYWFGPNQEAERTILCDSTVGTGVNAVGRSGGARYGNAGSRRGECKTQIRVNDYGAAPQR